MSVGGDWAFTERFGNVFIPDVEIEEDDGSYTFSAVRGYSASLAVFGIDDQCVGWIDTRTLGFETARTYLDSVKAEFESAVTERIEGVTTR